jgi:hypothetical protein
MDTSSSSRRPRSRSSKSKSKRVGYLNLKRPAAPVVTVIPVDRKRAKRDFELRNDFHLVDQLDRADIEKLDKLRNDLRECVERVVRVEHAFQKELKKHATKSERIQSISKCVGEVPFYSEFQRKLLGNGVTDILKSKQELYKRQKEEAAEREYLRNKARIEACFCSL